MKKIVMLILMTALIGGNGVYAAGDVRLPADVGQNHWAYESVKAAAVDGWLILDSQGGFSPDGPASRETVASLLTGAWKTAEKQGRVSGTLPSAAACRTRFSDMDTVGTEAQDALKQLVAAGVLSGYPGGIIKPEGTVTRLEMAIILSRVCKDAGTLPQTFTDQEQIPAWGKVAAEKAVAMGLVSGYTDGSFQPLRGVTRAEAVQMISRWVYPQKSTAVVSRGQLDAPGDPMTQSVLRLINEERIKRGLAPLRVNQTLTQVAMFKAGSMAQGNYFAHTSPEGEGVEALFTRLGVRNWTGIGENLLQMKGAVTAEKAVATWMQSDTHRDIILTPYTDTGIGFAKASDGTAYIAQAFAAF